jgi:mRNA-degrading endonuclease RelE of RelBE toxin-antitoxin system
VAGYRLLIKPSASKELEALPLKDRKRGHKRIQGLSSQLRPAAFGKLSDLDRFRVRRGDYRNLGLIDDSLQAVTIVRVGDRREVYR